MKQALNVNGQVKKKLLRRVVIALIICGCLGLVYSIGYRQGYSKGKDEQQPTTSQNNKPTDSLQSILKTASGTITTIEGNKITIKTSRNETRSFIINDQTKITQKTTELTSGDLRVGSLIVAFLSGEDETNQIATRIVVRDNQDN